jgi:hypothetical protein
MIGVLEDGDYRVVEVGEGDRGMGVLDPESANCRTEQGVVVPGHAVDVA